MANKRKADYDDYDDDFVELVHNKKKLKSLDYSDDNIVCTPEVTVSNFAWKTQKFVEAMAKIDAWNSDPSLSFSYNWDDEFIVPTEEEYSDDDSEHSIGYDAIQNDDFAQKTQKIEESEMVIKIPLSKLKITAIEKLDNRMKKLQLAE